MTNPATIGVIIVAAGSGKRFGGDVPKQWQSLGGLSPIERAWWAFTRGSLVKLGQFQIPAGVGIVVEAAHAAEAAALN